MLKSNIGRTSEVPDISTYNELTNVLRVGLVLTTFSRKTKCTLFFPQTHPLGINHTSLSPCPQTHPLGINHTSLSPCPQTHPLGINHTSLSPCPQTHPLGINHTSLSPCNALQICKYKCNLQQLDI